MPHAFKMNWVYEIPVGRGRRFGADMNPVAERHRRRLGVLGHRPRAAPARTTPAACDLVGMSQDELQKALPDPHRDERGTGTLTVFSMPQDIIDNTRRAYNTDPTSPTGYGADRRADRPLHRAGQQPGCVPVYAGDCGTPNQLLCHGSGVRPLRHADQEELPDLAARQRRRSTSRC